MTNNIYVGAVNYKPHPKTGVLIPYSIAAGNQTDIAMMIREVFGPRLGLKTGVRTGFATQEDAAEWATARYWREVAQKGSWDVHSITQADLGDKGSISRPKLPGLH